MAGIGFRIEKILEGDTYLDVLKAHFYSTIIFSGPWLMSIVTIFCLGYFSPNNISVSDIIFFRTAIIYIFAFSLIGVGVLYLSLSRYLSDKLYLKEAEAMVPILNSATALICVLQMIIGVCASFYLDVGSSIKILIVMIYVTISVLWVMMIFLTALRDYKAVSLIFLIGSCIALGGAIVFGGFWGLEGYFLGYFLGHFMIVILLAGRIFIEFRSKRFFDMGLFSFLVNNRDLVLLGIFYNLALWVDKIIFWYSQKSIQINGFLYSYSFYESTTFLAFLTIIPALSIFLIHIETDFYRKYKKYYTYILEKGTLSQILLKKEQMLASLRKSFAIVVISQGIVSVLSILFARSILLLLHQQAIQIPLFRLAVLGAFLNSLLLIVIIIILYFDFKKLALLVTVVFFVCNSLATWGTSYLPLPYLGYGYFFGALIALILAFYALDYKLKRLEYYTFALQPVAPHRDEEII